MLWVSAMGVPRVLPPPASPPCGMQGTELGQTTPPIPAPSSFSLKERLWRLVPALGTAVPEGLGGEGFACPMAAAEPVNRTTPRVGEVMRGWTLGGGLGALPPRCPSVGAAGRRATRGRNRALTQEEMGGSRTPPPSHRPGRDALERDARGPGRARGSRGWERRGRKPGSGDGAGAGGSRAGARAAALPVVAPPRSWGIKARRPQPGARRPHQRPRVGRGLPGRFPSTARGSRGRPRHHMRRLGWGSGLSPGGSARCLWDARPGSCGRC